MSDVILMRAEIKVYRRPIFFYHDSNSSSLVIVELLHTFFSISSRSYFSSAMRNRKIETVRQI